MTTNEIVQNLFSVCNTYDSSGSEDRGYCNSLGVSDDLPGMLLALRELLVQEYEDSTELFPQAVLGSRLRNRKNEILIQREEREIIQDYYPDFTLEDKGVN